VSAAFDRDRPKLFTYSKAWNVLFNRPAPAESGLAVAPDYPDARTYFLIPWKGHLMAGTGHASCESPDQAGRPTIEEMDRFISDLDGAVPALCLHRSDVKMVFHGLLPVVRQGSDELADRAVLLDHGRKGGPRGLLSVSGVKFTTARLVAEKTMRRLFPNSPKPVAYNNTLDNAIRVSLEHSIFALNNGMTGVDPDISSEILEDIVRSESVVHLHDLVFRRTNLWEDPVLALKASGLLSASLQMDRDYLVNDMQFLKRLQEDKKV